MKTQHIEVLKVLPTGECFVTRDGSEVACENMAANRIIAQAKRDAVEVKVEVLGRGGLAWRFVEPNLYGQLLAVPVGGIE